MKSQVRFFSTKTEDFSGTARNAAQAMRSYEGFTNHM
jgi:hypothetical protein